MIFLLILRSFSKDSMKYVGQMMYYGGLKAEMALISILIVVMFSCGNRYAAVSPDSEAAEDSHFHADNDIAMTVCSLVDAVRVGEQLDSAEYGFDGILTDGQGTPLYTDIAGNPGEWKVKVINDWEANISNLYLGDLMTTDLRNYILGALNLNTADLVTGYVNPANEQEFIWLYDIGDVNLSFSETEVKTPQGLEGIIMSISVFRK